MARYPQQLHLVELRERRLRSGDQRQQADHCSVLAALGLADGDTAVAMQLQTACTRGAGQVQGRCQGAQFGFVVAAIEAGSNGLLGELALGRKQAQPDADASWIGQGRAVEPGLPGRLDRAS